MFESKPAEIDIGVIAVYVGGIMRHLTENEQCLQRLLEAGGNPAKILYELTQKYPLYGEKFSEFFPDTIPVLCRPWGSDAPEMSMWREKWAKHR